MGQRGHYQRRVGGGGVWERITRGGRGGGVVIGLPYLILPDSGPGKVEGYTGELVGQEAREQAGDQARKRRGDMGEDQKGEQGGRRMGSEPEIEHGSEQANKLEQRVEKGHEKE